MGKRSKNSDKAGRSAEVRRLRREHNVTENIARQIVESKNPDKDLLAMRHNDRLRSQAGELHTLDYRGLRDMRNDYCPAVWSGWCCPDSTERAEHARTGEPKRRMSIGGRFAGRLALERAIVQLANLGVR